MSRALNASRELKRKGPRVGKYITFEDVRLRLIGKVRFSDNEDDENRMYVPLATRLIAEAEGQVELDLSPRYIAPFQTDNGTAFKNLPDVTRERIRTMCELQAVIRILETDFGSGTVVDAEAYSKNIAKRYQKYADQLLEKKTDAGTEASGWKYPPLPCLRLNYMNTEADDGYAGQVLSTSESTAGYAAKQINDPSLNFWTGLDRGNDP